MQGNYDDYLHAGVRQMLEAVHVCCRKVTQHTVERSCRLGSVPPVGLTQAHRLTWQ